MKIRSALVPGALSIGKRIADISPEAYKRLKWFDYYERVGRNARLTCRHFDISPQTFYRWRKRYDPKDLKTLESRSQRPKHVRQPTYSIELANAVLRLREAYPRWGKDKLVILLQRENIHVSASMVGRILKYLKARGILREPVTNHISVRKRIRPRSYAVRKPREYQASSPGDLVELDTLDVRPLPGVILKHFSSYDVVSKWNVLGIYPSAEGPLPLPSFSWMIWKGVPRIESEPFKSMVGVSFSLFLRRSVEDAASSSLCYHLAHRN